MTAMVIAKIVGDGDDAQIVDTGVVTTVPPEMVNRLRLQGFRLATEAEHVAWFRSQNIEPVAYIDKDGKRDLGAPGAALDDLLSWGGAVLADDQPDPPKAKTAHGGKAAHADKADEPKRSAKAVAVHAAETHDPDNATQARDNKTNDPAVVHPKNPPGLPAA